jgi:hypothetical protein
MKTQKKEPLLRMPGGSYASPDGRFYVERLHHVERRHSVGWCVQDALPRQLLQTGVRTLAEARVWMQRRRRAVR